MMSEIAPIYAKDYSDKEMLALVDFYKSPLGQKTQEVTPFITQESMAIAQRKGQETMPKSWKSSKTWATRRLLSEAQKKSPGRPGLSRTTSAKRQIQSDQVLPTSDSGMQP